MTRPTILDFIASPCPKCGGHFYKPARYHKFPDFGECMLIEFRSCGYEQKAAPLDRIPD